MKVLLIGPNSIHVRNYARTLKRSGHKVRILVPPSAKDWFADAEPETVRYAPFGLRRPLQVWSTLRAIAEEIHTFGPEVVHAHQLNVFAWSAARAVTGTALPLIITAYGSDVLVGATQSRILRWMARAALRRAAHVIAESSTLIRAMRQLEPRSQATYHRINFGTPIPTASGERRRRVVYSNRLHKSNYNIETIVHWFQGWNRLYPGEDWDLVIAGTGEGTDGIKQLVESLGIGERVRFVGWLSEVENRRWYEQALLYFSVPDSDSIAISLLEAMALGAVPVVSDIPSNHEVVLNGVNGLYLAPPEVIQSQLARLDIDLLRTINRRLVAELADPEICRAAFDRVYDEARSGASTSSDLGALP